MTSHNDGRKAEGEALCVYSFDRDNSLERLKKTTENQIRAGTGTLRQTRYEYYVREFYRPQGYIIDFNVLIFY